MYGAVPGEEYKLHGMFLLCEHPVASSVSLPLTAGAGLNGGSHCKHTWWRADLPAVRPVFGSAASVLPVTLAFTARDLA